MIERKNPLKLNPLQLRTLTLLQHLAKVPGASQPAGPGEVRITRFPPAHGDHFHIGDVMVSGRDASGLYNQAVWNALQRKGLARTEWPHAITLTADALGYDTGMGGDILHPAAH
jgi:hypothetical protein